MINQYVYNDCDDDATDDTSLFMINNLVCDKTITFSLS